MMLRTRKVLIFDIDGTLVNSGIDWGRIRELFRRFAGVDVDGKPLAEVLSTLPREARNMLEDIVRDAEESSLASIGVDPELRHLLSRAKRFGYAVAVVSLRGGGTASEVIERLGIKDFVDVLVTRDHTPRRDEQLATVLRLLQVGPSHAIFFGDTPWDAEAAKGLGLRFIRISGDDRVGKTPEDLLRKLREVLGARW